MLMSFPSANEIFQFTEFASHGYVFTIGYLINQAIFEITIRQPTSRSQRYVDATYTVQAEAIDTRVIGRSFSFLAWIVN
jgi:hypothetical protein